MTDDAQIPDPWHAGEVTMQSRAGSRERLRESGSRLIRPFMPAQHRRFFEQLPMIILGAADLTGDIWATALFGPVAFITTPNDRQLVINARLPQSDPLADSLQDGIRLGLLGIDFATRRRNRLNGVIQSAALGTLSVGVHQSFGNCPKYILPRRPEPNPHYGRFMREDHASSSEQMVSLVQQADTFFIASGFDGAGVASSRGVDVSHRGGPEGFVHCDDKGRLVVPDFAGNGFFNTLGNLLMEPRAGLLFFDFNGGHTLHLTCSAEIISREDQPLPVHDSDRIVRFTVHKACLMRNTLPYLWHTIEPE